jgi:hypothetical protein
LHRRSQQRRHETQAWAAHFDHRGSTTFSTSDLTKEEGYQTGTDSSDFTRVNARRKSLHTNQYEFSGTKGNHCLPIFTADLPGIVQ